VSEGERIRWVPVREAAERLGISRSRVVTLCTTDGRLNSIKRDGRRWVLEDDVERYAGAQKSWRRSGGRWTSFGRLPKGVDSGRRWDEEGPDWEYALVHRVLQGSPTAKTAGTAALGRRDAGGLVEGVEADAVHAETWVRAEVAARILGLSEVRVGVLGREGRLERRFGSVAEQMAARRADGARPRGRPPACEYRLSSVIRLLAERESAQWSRAQTPHAWREGRTRKPFIRSRIEAPAGDRLISRSEAAGILGVAPARVSVLVAEGRLFGWQEHPGKPGCPLWLSEAQVWRYAHSADRLRRRRSQRGEPQELPPEEERAMEIRAEAREMWRTEHGLGAADRDGNGPAMHRVHGEFVTTRQAALLLGIGPGSVGSLRRRGRLQGHQRPVQRRRTSRGMEPGAGNRWWFYRREDVEALAAERRCSAPPARSALSSGYSRKRQMSPST